MIDGGDVTIVDVRAESEYREGHIPDAILIPESVIKERAQEDLPGKDRTIIVYCRSGVRSARAARALVELGYTRVYDIGGILDWPYQTVID